RSAATLRSAAAFSTLTGSSASINASASVRACLATLFLIVLIIRATWLRWIRRPAIARPFVFGFIRNSPFADAGFKRPGSAGPLQVFLTTATPRYLQRFARVTELIRRGGYRNDRA